MSKNTNFSFTTTRLRKWSLVSYLPFEMVKDICEELPNIRYYAIAYHDKDLHSDGTPKEPHTHLCLVLKDARTAQSICRHFVDDVLNAGNCRAEPLIYLKKSYEYLLHKNETEVGKYHYEPSVVVTNAKNYFIGDGDDDKDSVITILDDINNGVALRTLISLYGRDFVLHYSQFTEMAKMLKQDDILQLQKWSIGVDPDVKIFPVQDSLPF